MSKPRFLLAALVILAMYFAFRRHSTSNVAEEKALESAVTSEENAPSPMTDTPPVAAASDLSNVSTREAPTISNEDSSSSSETSSPLSLYRANPSESRTRGEEKVNVEFPFHSEFTMNKEEATFRLQKSRIADYATQGKIPPEVSKYDGIYQGEITFNSEYEIPAHSFQVALKFRALSPLGGNSYVAVTDILMQEKGSSSWYRVTGTEREDFQTSNPFEVHFLSDTNTIQLPLTLVLFHKRHADKLREHVGRGVFKLELNIRLAPRRGLQARGPVDAFPNPRTVGSYRIEKAQAL